MRLKAGLPKLASETQRTRRPLTSTSFIMGTGLKKWRPANRSCLVVALAMLVICRDEVLLAKIVCLWREKADQNESHVRPRSKPWHYMTPVHETARHCPSAGPHR